MLAPNVGKELRTPRRGVQPRVRLAIVGFRRESWTIEGHLRVLTYTAVQK
jgi:hypothetical protein